MATALRRCLPTLAASAATVSGCLPTLAASAATVSGAMLCSTGGSGSFVVW